MNIEEAKQAVRDFTQGSTFDATSVDIKMAMRVLVEAVELLEQDKARLDWLADTNQNIGNVILPEKCVIGNIDSLRRAIDSAMRL